MTITHRTLLDENGKPEAAVIPWKIFIEIQQMIDLDQLDEVETKELAEALADSKARNREAFIPASEV